MRDKVVFFSRIYIERGLVEESPYVAGLLKERFKGLRVTQINHYKDIFSRPRQEIELQKRRPAIILARKRPPYLYEGSKLCRSSSDAVEVSDYYALPMMNCPMSCEYCFLRGMYPSAHLVYFVNFDEVFEEISSAIYEHSIGKIALSFESDLVYLDPILRCLEPWLDFTRQHPETTFEIRTKAGGRLHFLKETRPLKNVRLAWSLSPPRLHTAFEHGSPSIGARLKAIRDAIECGWQVTICLDPILYTISWEGHYMEFISKLFTQVPPGPIREVQIGVFRMGKEQLKEARKRYPSSQLLHYPYEIVGNTYTYPKKVAETLLSKVKGLLMEHITEERIRIVGV